jgi:ABC-2 type transport system permease protein
MSRLADDQLVQLTLARLREMVREPEVIFWSFAFPILLVFALGVAFQGAGPAPVRVAVEQPAAGAAAALRAAGLTVLVLPAAEAEAALRRGRVALVVGSRTPGYVFRFDPTRDESRLARLAAGDALQRAAGRADPVPVATVQVVEPGARYIDFLVPGLIGLNLLGTGLWGVGYAVVRMRIGGLLKRLQATPMGRGRFLLSFILARLAFLAAELAALLAFAHVVFDVTVRGSFAAVLLIATLGAFSFAGVGLLIASRTRTQEGVMGLINLVTVPMWIFSGVFFSAEHFPKVLQPLIAALPLTALLDALRAVMNDGAALAATAGSLAIVALWGAVSFAAALALFRWQ